MNCEDSGADSDVAEPTGRLSALGNGWKREHESTFLDSDWPSFNNAVYAFSLSLWPNQSRKVNVKVCSGRSLHLIEQLSAARLHVGGLPSWPLFFKAGF